MTKLKYYVIELHAMPKTADAAPTADPLDNMDQEIKAQVAKTCAEINDLFKGAEQICFAPSTKPFDGGDCDICGCHFITGLLQAHHCPNCGSKRWDHITTDKARRLEDCQPWVMEKVKKGKTYQYWMVSWREGDKVRNVHIGSCRKLDREAALQKARAIKRAALGMDA